MILTADGGSPRHSLARSICHAMPVVLAAALLIGCADSSATSRRGAAADCLKTDNERELQGSGVIVVAVDAQSRNAHIGGGPLLHTVVSAPLSSGAHLLLTSLRPAESSLVSVTLTGKGNNEFVRRKDLQCKEENLGVMLDKISGADPSPSRDVLTGLRKLASHLQSLEAKGPIDVVLLMKMLNTTKPVDMTDPGVINRGSDAMLEMAMSNGDLPKCVGWRVYALGDHTTALNDPHTDMIVREFWKKLFQKCGGRLVVYDTALLRFPVIEEVDSPFYFPPPDPQTGERQAPVPADTLFSLGSAVLSADAATTLTEVAEAIKASGACHVLVEGHTDNTPGPNQRLSEDRAEAVRTWLIAHGVDGNSLQAVGHGESKPVASNEDPAGRAKNRRVAITVMPGRCPS